MVYETAKQRSNILMFKTHVCVFKRWNSVNRVNLIAVHSGRFVQKPTLQMTLRGQCARTKRRRIHVFVSFRIFTGRRSRTTRFLALVKQLHCTVILDTVSLNFFLSRSNATAF
jgi:hypothetical protein